MATKKDRGTKRTCQNGECGARFYDLNRNPIICPICGSKYAIAHSPIGGRCRRAGGAGAAQAEEARVRAGRRRGARPRPRRRSPTSRPMTRTTPRAEADETFLEEEEEDGGDVSDIIGGPVEGEEER